MHIINASFKKLLYLVPDMASLKSKYLSAVRRNGIMHQHVIFNSKKQHCQTKTNKNEN